MSRPRSTRKPRLSTGFSLGGEQAEADPFLDDAFVEFGGYGVVTSQEDPHCFLIGRTGSGKSAVLQRLEDVRGDHVIRINPEDLSLPYIVDLGVVRYLSALGVNLDPLFIALWKHIFLVEIIKHRYKIDSPAKKSNVLATLIERVGRDASKKAAIDYLEEFGSSFWAETDARVREITTSFASNLETHGGLDLSVPPIDLGLGIKEGESASTTTRTEYADRYQRIVNETQLARLNQMIAVLNDEILGSAQNFTYIVIDDLDRDWVDERVANDLIRCLFRAVLDIQRVQNLKIIVALRTNIFDHLAFGSRTGGQEEKFRALQYRIRWTQAELVEVADRRVEVAANRAELPALTTISDLLPQSGKTRGNPMDYILDRTMMRPRDLIAFLNEALTIAGGKTRLTWGDITAAEAAYSRNRLLALRDEWKPNYPGIDKVFEVFRGAPPEMDQKGVTPFLDNIALLTVERHFEGVRWITETTETLWSGANPPEAWADSYQPLVKLLYDIGFLGIKEGTASYFSHDHSGFADAPTSDAARFMVHPSLRATLGVRSGRSKQSGFEGAAA
jgi:hypothetical protein